MSYPFPAGEKDETGESIVQCVFPDAKQVDSPGNLDKQHICRLRCKRFACETG